MRLNFRYERISLKKQFSRKTEKDSQWSHNSVLRTPCETLLRKLQLTAEAFVKIFRNFMNN